MPTPIFPGFPGPNCLHRSKTSAPGLVRILITPSLNLRVSEAMNEGHIHRYLTEPLTNSTFIEVVKGGVKLFGQLKEKHKEGIAGLAHEPAKERLTEAEKIERAKDQYQRLTSQQENPAEVSESEEERLVRALKHLAEAEQQIQYLNEKLAEAAEAGKRAAEDCLLYREENDVLNSRVSELSEERDRLAQELSRAQNESAEAEQRVSRMSADLERFQSESLDLGARLQALEQEHAESLEDVSSLRLRLSQEISIKDQCLARLLSVEAECESLRSRFDAARTEQERLIEENRSLAEQVEEYKGVKGLEEMPEISADDLTRELTEVEIYAKAAEWRNRAAKLVRVNRALEIRLRNVEEEIIRAVEAKEKLTERLELEKHKQGEELARWKLQYGSLSKSLREKEEELAACR